MARDWRARNRELQDELRKLQAHCRELELAARWIYSLKGVELRDERAFRRLDVRQIHHWLYKRGWRPEPWLMRKWVHKTWKSDDGELLDHFVIDGNGYSDRHRRMGELVSDMAKLYDRSPLAVLREMLATKPKTILVPFFKAGDAVRLRGDYHSEWVYDGPKPVRTEIPKGTVGVVRRVTHSPKRWIVYHTLFEGFTKTFPVQQLELERASTLDRLAVET